MILTLLIILIVVVVAISPVAPYARGWGYYPSGILGAIVLVLILLYLLGAFGSHRYW